VDDLSGVPAAHLDQRDVRPVTATSLLAAASSTSNPGGVTGWLLHVNGTWAYVVIGFLAFAESAFMIGFFFPGETAIIVGGVLAGLGRLNLGVIIVVVVVCAISGDSVGFEVGKKSGPWLLEHRPLKGKAGVHYTLGLLERYGGPAVFLGRFITFVRVVIPGLAGMSGIRYRTFLFWNVLGGVCWGVGYTLLGYVVGISIEHLLSQIGLWFAGVAAVAVAGFVAFEVRRRRRERARIALQLADMGDGVPATGDAQGLGSVSAHGGDAVETRDEAQTPGPEPGP